MSSALLFEAMHVQCVYNYYYISQKLYKAYVEMFPIVTTKKEIFDLISCR